MSNYGKVYKKFFNVYSEGTQKLADVYGYPCDVYYPQFPTDDSHGNYDNVNIYSTHKNSGYSDTPDIVGVNFYIVHLLRKQIMNSDSSEFENFYLEEDSDRPFIEVHPKQELPIQSKVVVHFDEETKVNFFIEKKTKSAGSTFLRMYLNPLV